MTTAPYLTRQEVAALFGVSPGTVTRWAKEGRLRSQLTPGGHRRYPRNSVLRLQEELQRGKDGLEGHRPAAEYAGWLLLAAIMFFAAMEAVDVLGFTLAAVLVRQFIAFSSQIIFGLVVIAVGLLLANLAARAISGTGLPQAGLLSWISRISILVLATAIGLRMMGIANDIVVLGFAIPLAAIGVAAAIAFGVGGREIAGRELNNLVESIRSNGSQS